MVVIVVLLVVGLVLGTCVAVALVVGVIVAQSKARKEARTLLATQGNDWKKGQRCIQVLRHARDTESQELVRRLMELYPTP